MPTKSTPANDTRPIAKVINLAKARKERRPPPKLQIREYLSVVEIYESASPELIHYITQSDAHEHADPNCESNALCLLASALRQLLALRADKSIGGLARRSAVGRIFEPLALYDCVLGEDWAGAWEAAPEAEREAVRAQR